MSTRFFETSFSRSLGIHLVLLFIAFFYVMHAKPFVPAAPIEMTFVDKVNEAEKNAQKLADDRNSRMVRRSEGEIALEAKKDAFLSEKTKVVEEEHSARTVGEAVTAGKAVPESQVNHHSVPQKITVSDLGVKVAPKLAQEPYQETRNWANPQMGEAVRGGEYIQGLKEGEMSALNTKESIFFSYFDRVRKQLDQAWQPILRENIAHVFQTGRRIASNTEFVTRTLVTLNDKGEILKVQLLEDSGTHDVDQAAVDALNKAGPYPNPPKGLIDAQGLVQIRWDFILKT